MSPITATPWISAIEAGLRQGFFQAGEHVTHLALEIAGELLALQADGGALPAEPDDPA